MKKIYALSMACLIAGFSMAQKKSMVSNPLGTSKMAKVHTNYERYKVAKKQNAHEKALTSFWTNNFDTPADWSMSNTSNPSFDWVIGTSGPASGILSPLTSTSGGNFALLDSDGAGSGTTQNSILTYNNPVNCAGKPVVIFSFETYYARYLDSVFVEVSSDNANWTSFRVLDYLAINGSTANPEEIFVDISSVAANQATVYFQFHYIGAWDYAWMVDDIKFSEITGTDVIMTAGGLYEATPFILTPLSQILPNYSIYGSLYNFGADTLNTVNWEATVLTYFGTETVNGTNANPIPVLGTDYSVATPQVTSSVLFPDTTPAMITFNASLADDDTTNNLDTTYFYVLDSTMGVNTSVTSYYPSLDSGVYIQAFLVYNQDTVTSLSAITYFQKHSSMIGKKFYMYLLDTNLQIVARTKSYTVTAADTGLSGIGEHTFLFNDPQLLDPGLYFAAYIDSVFGANKVSGVTFTDEAFYSNFSYFQQVGDTSWYDFGTGQGASFNIWVNFGHATPVSVNEVSKNTLGLKVYPNPASTELYVELSNNSATQIELVDALGQVVYTNRVAGNTRKAINVENLSKGMYLLRTYSAQGTQVQKVEIK